MLWSGCQGPRDVSVVENLINSPAKISLAQENVHVLKTTNQSFWLPHTNQSRLDQDGK